MSQSTFVKLAAGCITAAFVTLALWLICRHLLPLVLPIGIAYGFAAWVGRIGTWLTAHTGLSKRYPHLLSCLLASLFCVAILWCGGKIITIVGKQAGTLVTEEFWDWNALPDWLTAHVPPPLRQQIDDGITALVQSGASWLAGWAGTLVTMLPHAALTVFFTIASLFYWLTDRTGIVTAAHKMARTLLPSPLYQWWKTHPEWQERYRTGRDYGRTCGRHILSYLRAECLLSGIVLVVVWLGLSVLGMAGALAWSVLVALADLLPLIGSGVLLVPWGIFAILSGRTIMGIGLLVLWLVTWLLRQCLEPKLTGHALGVHPYLMLVGMYSAYQLAGFGGMLICAMVLGSIGKTGTYDA